MTETETQEAIGSGAALPDSADPVEIVPRLTRLDRERRLEAFRSLPPELSVDVFCQLEPSIQADLLGRLEAEQASALLEALDPDDRARLFEEMPDELASGLISGLSPAERRATQLLLAYPEESAGRIMSPDFIGLRPEMTVSEALAELRRRSDGAETIYVLPVHDEAKRLLGTVELEDLVLAEPDERIGDLLSEPQYAVNARDDQEVVARLMQSADLFAIPVVEDDNRLVGIVTIDDAVDVLQEEDSEDIARAGATEPIGRPYFSVSILRLVRARIVWLSLLAVAATLTVNVLSAFEATLEAVVSLALFIPLLIGIGGNAGAQAATTIVRAMATENLGTGDLAKVVLRETSVGFLLGSLLGTVAFLLVALIFGETIAIIVGLTLVAVCTLATLVGSAMPLLARAVGIDPAVISAPVVTTLVDATGLLVYFLIAQAVLGL